MPSTIQPRGADIAHYNTILHPEQYAIEWRPFYERGLADTAALRTATRHEANVFYGEHPAQILDIYYPPTPVRDAPVLVFLHGGAFREGHPAQYGFIGRPYIERGAIFVCAGYRLAPDCFYPDTIADVARLVGWLYHHIGPRGGDPGRIVLSGHSSGGTVSALACVRDDWQADARVPRDVLKTVILCGATYDFRTDFVGNLVTDVARRAEATAVCNIARVPETALFTFGVNEINRGDGRRFERSARGLAQAMEERGTRTTLIPLEYADHHGSCAALCDVNGPVFEAAARIVAQAGRPVTA